MDGESLAESLRQFLELSAKIIFRIGLLDQSSLPIQICFDFGHDWLEFGGSKCFSPDRVIP